MKAATQLYPAFRPQKPTITILPLYTADDLREVEACCKRQCREEWWGATVIGFLGGLLFSAFAVAVLSF
jgi:hypothetical protein